MQILSYNNRGQGNIFLPRNDNALDCGICQIAKLKWDCYCNVHAHSGVIETQNKSGPREGGQEKGQTGGRAEGPWLKKEGDVAEEKGPLYKPGVFCRMLPNLFHLQRGQDTIKDSFSFSTYHPSIHLPNKTQYHPALYLPHSPRQKDTRPLSLGRISQPIAKLISPTQCELLCAPFRLTDSLTAFV